jgi:hypothetical protein
LIEWYYTEAFRCSFGVDRQAIRDELARTERQLAEVAARIEKQKLVLNRLEAAGENTAHAAFLLEQWLGCRKLNEAHQARLKRELVLVGRHASDREQ